MGDDGDYFLDVGPEIGLQFGEDEDAVDLHFEGAVPGEGHDLVLLLIEVSVESEGHGGDVVPLYVMFGWFIARDVRALEEGPYLGFEFVVELVVLGLVVARAPVVQVAVDAVLNLDLHERSNNFINVTNPPLKYSKRPPNVSPQMAKGMKGEDTKGS